MTRHAAIGMARSTLGRHEWGSKTHVALPERVDLGEVGHRRVHLDGDGLAGLDMHALKSPQRFERHTTDARARRSKHAEHDVVGVHGAGVRYVNAVSDRRLEEGDGLCGSAAGQLPAVLRGEQTGRSRTRQQGKEQQEQEQEQDQEQEQEQVQNGAGASAAAAAV